jgi:hypothetical protein
MGPETRDPKVHVEVTATSRRRLRHSVPYRSGRMAQPVVYIIIPE